MNVGFLLLFIAAGILYQFSVCKNSTSSNPKFSPIILIVSLILLAFSSKIIPGNELLPPSYSTEQSRKVIVRKEIPTSHRPFSAFS